MPKNDNEIKGDLYTIFDISNLTGGYLLNSKKNMTTLIGTVRTKLADELLKYIKELQEGNDGK